jgi:TldD protein
VLQAEVGDLLEKVITIMGEAKVAYGDVRYESSRRIGVSKDKAEERVQYQSSDGFYLRVLKGDEWRSVGLAGMTKKDLIKNAVELSKFKPTVRAKSGYRPLEPWKLKQEVKARIDFIDVDLEEKLGLVRDAYSKLTIDKKIINAASIYAEDSSQKSFFNTEGTALHVKVPIIRFIVTAHAKAGKDMQGEFMSKGKYGVGYEFIKEVDVDNMCSETVKGAVSLLGAKTAPSGRFPVILDSDMTGLIAHESFGHGLEADQVLRNRSFLSDKLNKKVASENVTIVDNSAYENGYGTFAFDDEGVKSKRNVLVENGVLTGFLHSRETASAFSAKPTGNGRAQNFAHKIYVRMSNTYFEKGDWSLEEMIEDMDRGVYVTKSSFGMEDPLGGGIQVTSQKGFLIEHGKLTQLLRPITLSGKVLELLPNVDAVGKDFHLHPGTCGKGFEDFVRVTSGGPSIRIKEAIVGGG